VLARASPLGRVTASVSAGAVVEDGDTHAPGAVQLADQYFHGNELVKQYRGQRDVPREAKLAAI
jgi:hypothetical protein